MDKRVGAGILLGLIGAAPAYRSNWASLLSVASCEGPFQAVYGGFYLGTAATL